MPAWEGPHRPLPHEAGTGHHDGRGKGEIGSAVLAATDVGHIEKDRQKANRKEGEHLKHGHKGDVPVAEKVIQDHRKVRRSAGAPQEHRKIGKQPFFAETLLFFSEDSRRRRRNKAAPQGSLQEEGAYHSFPAFLLCAFRFIHPILLAFGGSGRGIGLCIRPFRFFP